MYSPAVNKALQKALYLQRLPQHSAGAAFQSNTNVIMKKTIIAGLLAAFCSTGFATNYYVVVPVKGKSAGAGPGASEILVSLAGASLPAGQVGSSYSHDIKPYLTVTGDTAFNAANVTWSVSAGGLPAGLTLGTATGVLEGIPSASGAFAVTVTASYKTKSAQRSYSLNVGNNPAVLVQNNGYRAWSDGSLAASCFDYLHPVGGRRYDGATGDGVYRVRLPSGGSVDTFCDMTSNGGGWTLVANLGQKAPVVDQVGAVAVQGLVTKLPQSSVLSKLSDSDIQRIPHTTLFAQVTAGALHANSYYSSACVLSFSGTVPASSPCAQSYTDVGLTAAMTGGGGPEAATAVGLVGLRAGTLPAYLASAKFPYPYAGALNTSATIWIR